MVQATVCNFGLFIIGSAPVECSATDSSVNEAKGSFNVTAKGATDQLADVEELMMPLALPSGISTSPQAKLNDAFKGRA